MTDLGGRDALRLVGTSLAAFASVGLDPALGADSVPAASIVGRRIPSSGEKLPVIGIGTWQTVDVGPTAAERAPLEEVLRTFAEIGGKVVDSSPMYGNSEEVTGDIAARLGLHGKLFIATKVWTSGKQAGIEQMEESMRKTCEPTQLT